MPHKATIHAATYTVGDETFEFISADDLPIPRSYVAVLHAKSIGNVVVPPTVRLR